MLILQFQKYDKLRLFSTQKTFFATNQFLVTFFDHDLKNILPFKPLFVRHFEQI